MKAGVFSSAARSGRQAGVPGSVNVDGRSVKLLASPDQPATTRMVRQLWGNPAMSIASSSTHSERDERVFAAAVGIMDSHQDGEAVAAFLRARAILHRHGGGFRRMLERSHEAERLNAELGEQNVQLLHENAALRARDSRPVSAAGGRTLSSPAAAVPGFRRWYISIIAILAILASCGVLGIPAALMAIAGVLSCAALTRSQAVTCQRSNPR